jgi:predicted helicase
VSTSVHEVIEAFRQAPSNRERGTSFEQLMVKYLRLDPLFSRKYSDVWMWMDWPGRQGKADAGIDLVAKDRGSGEYTAIQCKFYEPTHTLSRGDIDAFFTASGKVPFKNRIIISTTDKWGTNAEDACDEQQIPVQRIGLADIAAAPIDWEFIGPADELKVRLAPAAQHKPRPHQQLAIEKVFEGFETSDRGKLIMACGTGKTFTALKIAEYTARTKNAPATVLFLVPSISLLSQTLREWSAQSTVPMRSFAVCSDNKVVKRYSGTEDINVHDLALPATTDSRTLHTQIILTTDNSPLTVVFSTYQSIDVVAGAQKMGLPEFDLIICDEAHRTTGVTLTPGDESQFVKVHDNSIIAGQKRLYMTATPRLFAEETKSKASEADAVLASMDDEKLYGPEFHRLGFGEAVSNGLLTDYKVMILTVDQKYIAGPLQRGISDGTGELSLDDAAKIVGCWNGLAKRTSPEGENDFGSDTQPMQRAVAFLRDIESSKKITDKFKTVIGAYEDADEEVLRCDVHHVDGTYNALKRNHELEWLKAPLANNECRILTNARCLSEGVDVPALDAVLFLSPRNSVVDVVQSVGRVMRLAPGKSYGYIILPVGVPAGDSPGQALSDNKRFKVVWQVLQALRAHDDRFNATVNKLELNKSHVNDSILTGHVTGHEEPVQDEGVQTGPTEPTRDDGADVAPTPVEVLDQAALFTAISWRDAIFAKIVDKVGARTYWENWAKDVADIAQAQRTRIEVLLDGASEEISEAFDRFVTALQANLNDSIDTSDAINMLCQHLITRPVFDALFEGYDFAQQNPVSKVMQAMVETLHDQSLEAETKRLERFYASVRMRASGITNPEGKQRIVVELYQKFFRLGFKKTSEALGIVYTPVPIVDFILHAADDILQHEFGESLSSRGVHVLDPFTGTGTFIVRLLQSGLIRPEDLLRKYENELHANEIILLAYYIAAINIEATFHGLHTSDYKPFDGIVLTDTFQIGEANDTMDEVCFPQNNDRIARQLASRIRVIVGNPPYSVGQNSANDNNANMTYETLDRSIEETYVRRSTATLKNSLYDSYVRAIRWATERIGDAGIVAYVTNGGWIDGITADGIRLALADDFNMLYVYNLRGNARMSGEKRRKERGNVFGEGARTTVAILIAVKTPAGSTKCRILYRDIGDYLTRDDKLDIISKSSLSSVEWREIDPNENGDWLNQRTESFRRFPAIADKKVLPGEMTVFATSSGGLKTNRDAWMYNFSKRSLASNVKRMIDFYNTQVDVVASVVASGSGTIDINQVIDTDPRKISWDRADKPRLARGERYEFDPGAIIECTYRPFTRQYVYFGRKLNNTVYQLPKIFPTSTLSNMGIYQVGMASAVPFSVLMTDRLPDLHVTGSGSGGQFYSKYTYEKDVPDQLSFDDLDSANQYRRVDNITDALVAEYRRTLGQGISKDDIFFYTYGVLHSSQYRTSFEADLQKMLPRIPRPTKVEDFNTFADAGRRLADLHVNYEFVEPYALNEVVRSSENVTYRLTKLSFSSAADKTSMVYNGHLTLAGIPEDAHRYILGTRSALEWLIDRYRVKTDGPSGIVNDPNDWCDEHNDPRYVVDLVKRIVTVSVETMKIVDSLPELDLG